MSLQHGFLFNKFSKLISRSAKFILQNQVIQQPPKILETIETLTMKIVMNQSKREKDERKKQTMRKPNAYWPFVSRIVR